MSWSAAIWICIFNLHDWHPRQLCRILIYVMGSGYTVTAYKTWEHGRKLRGCSNFRQLRRVWKPGPYGIWYVLRKWFSHPELPPSSEHWVLRSHLLMRLWDNNLVSSAHRSESEVSTFSCTRRHMWNFLSSSTYSGPSGCHDDNKLVILKDRLHWKCRWCYNYSFVLPLRLFIDRMMDTSFPVWETDTAWMC